MGRGRDPELGQEPPELRAILRQVEAFGGGSEHAHAAALQVTGQRQRRLASELHHDPEGSFGLAHLEHVLQRERLEVQTVAGVVIGGDRLRVGVDHHGLQPRLAQREGRVDARIVELDPLADPVRPRPEDDHARTIPPPDLGLLLVGGVVIGSPGRELAGAGVHGLEHRHHPQPPAGGSHFVLAGSGQPRDPSIRQPHALGLAEPFRRDLRQGPPAQGGGGLRDAGDLIHEPGVDARRCRDLLDGPALGERSLDEQESPLGRGGDEVERIGRCGLGIRAEVEAALQRAIGLAERLGERAADGHDLAHRLHLGGEDGVGLRELLEPPPRDLHGHVVQGRLERSEGLAGDVVVDLVEGEPHGQHCRDLGDGEPGGLGSQRAGTRHPGIHLDEDNPPVVGAHGELDVRTAGVDAYGSNAGQAVAPHHLVFAVGERLGRGDRDGVPRMHAHWVHVLDRADDNRVVRAVAHHLQLELLPARQGLLYQDLVHRARGEPLRRNRAKFLCRAGHPAPPAPQDERGPHDHRVTERLCGRERLLDRVGEARSGQGKPGLAHRGDEQAPVLGSADGL